MRFIISLIAIFFITFNVAKANPIELVDFIRFVDNNYNSEEKFGDLIVNTYGIEPNEWTGKYAYSSREMVEGTKVLNVVVYGQPICNDNGEVLNWDVGCNSRGRSEGDGYQIITKYMYRVNVITPSVASGYFNQFDFDKYLDSYHISYSIVKKDNKTAYSPEYIYYKINFNSNNPIYVIYAKKLTLINNNAKGEQIFFMIKRVPNLF